MHVFSSLSFIFKELILLAAIKVSSSKTQINVETMCVNGMWKIGLTHTANSRLFNAIDILAHAVNVNPRYSFYIKVKMYKSWKSMVECAKKWRKYEKMFQTLTNYGKVCQKLRQNEKVCLNLRKCKQYVKVCQKLTKYKRVCQKRYKISVDGSSKSYILSFKKF